MSKLRFYQSIVTKYIGPSNVKGSRIKATAAAGSVTLHLDHSLNIEQNHAAAALALANKYKWRGTWIGGGMPDDSGYVFVSSDSGDEPAFVTQGEIPMKKYKVSVFATKEGAVHMNNAEHRTYVVSAESVEGARSAAIEAAYKEGGLEHINPRTVTALPD